MKRLPDFCNANSISYKKDVNLKTLSTFKIGGVAPYIVSPDSAEQVSVLIRFLRENNLTYKVIGNGSNILFPD